MKHPIQPVVLDDQNTARFKKNAIVRFLLDAGQFDMNQIACMPFSQEDREQFVQLIGYSVCGFADLSYATDETVAEADELVRKAMLSSSLID